MRGDASIRQPGSIELCQPVWCGIGPLVHRSPYTITDQPAKVNTEAPTKKSQTIYPVIYPLICTYLVLVVIDMFLFSVDWDNTVVICIH